MAVAGLLLNNWNSFVILVLRPVNIHRSKISIIQKLIISPTALPLTFTNQDAIFSKAHSFGHEAMHELIIATTSIKLHQEIALTITKLKQKTRSNTKPLEKTDKLVKLFIFTLTDDKQIQDQLQQNRMSKQKIENPQTFQFASVVVKDSKTGITCNRRLLMVKGGHLYYYSNVPKFFDGNPKSLEYFHELPKSSIDLVHIKKLKGFQGSSSCFEIHFDQKFMMQREDIRKTLTESCSFSAKNKKDEVVWRFTCENYSVKQKWVAYLSELREYFLREKDQIEQYFWNIDQQHQRVTHVAAPNALKTPWRDTTLTRKQYKTFDTKTLGDIRESDLQIFQNSGKTKPERISSSYKVESNLQSYDFQMETLDKTDGLRPLNMKKMKSMQVHSSKDI